MIDDALFDAEEKMEKAVAVAVSYTHLKLPTSDLV